MGVKKQKNKGGRPKKEIIKKQFEGLCAIHCTQDEICDILDCSVDVLNNWCNEIYGDSFSKVFKQKSSTGKASVRRSQFNMAQKNPSMSIWWGKQHLGQTENTKSTEDDPMYKEIMRFWET